MKDLYACTRDLLQQSVANVQFWPVFIAPRFDTNVWHAILLHCLLAVVMQERSRSSQIWLTSSLSCSLVYMGKRHDRLLREQGKVRLRRTTRMKNWMWDSVERTSTLFLVGPSLWSGTEQPNPRQEGSAFMPNQNSTRQLATQ